MNVATSDHSPVARPLTPLQSRVLSFIRSYMAENSGRAPTIPEISRAVGASSKSSASCQVNALVKLGLLLAVEGAHRSIRLADAVDAVEVAGRTETTENVLAVGTSSEAESSDSGDGNSGDEQSAATLPTYRTPT